MDNVGIMVRTTKIINHVLYLKLIQEISIHEKERIFCKHDVEHGLAVARIAWIQILSNHAQDMFNKEVVYAIGLLHDIGRAKQYQNGGKHAEYSVDYAKKILMDCDFSVNEIATICDAILHHHDGEGGSLNKAICEADNESRNCWVCDAKKECKWKVFNTELRH